MSKEQLFKDYQNQRWSFMEYNEDDVKAVSEMCSVPQVLSKVLIHNVGSSALSDIEKIISPDVTLLRQTEGLSDPKQLDLAIERVRQAQKKNEIIYVNGDPDADGISGGSILVAGLRQLGIKTQYLFPIRPTEGHGLQVRIIDQAKAAGASLIITTDCGTKDTDAVDYANSVGMDVIITDHHVLGHKLPNAHAIVNPFLYDGDSPFRAVAGSSVSYFFILALYNQLKVEFPDFLEEFGLTVSALGSLSDRVSMKSPLNRLIVKHGVDFFRESQREGIKALRDVSFDRVLALKPRHLSRTVIPRLNAPGRIGNPDENIPDSSIVVDLLLLGKGKKNKAKANKMSQVLSSIFQAETEQKKEASLDREAARAASDVDSINEKRKYITAKIEDEMDALIDEQVSIETDKIIIVQGKDWNSGVIGIDTDRLKERFLRPAVILSEKTGSDYVRGSSRSIPRINVYECIDKVEAQFQKEHNRPLFQSEVISMGQKKVVNAFGGHSQACGFTMHKNDVESFKQMLRAIVNELPLEQFEYHYDVIDSIKMEQVTPKFIARLDDFSPYGQRFEFPVFYLENCEIKGGRVFGNRYQTSTKQHVSFKVSSLDSKQSRFTLEAVGFGLWEKYCFVKENSGSNAKIDLIFMPEIDSRTKSPKIKQHHVRLNVLDIRISNS